MRDGLAAETTEERDAIVLNVTQHNTENNRLFNHHCPFFQQRSIQAKMHKSHANMATWIYQCYASLVSRLFLVPWQRVLTKGDNYRRARLKIACPCGQVKTTSLYPSANIKISCVQQQVMSLHFRLNPFLLSRLGSLSQTVVQAGSKGLNSCETIV